MKFLIILKLSSTRSHCIKGWNSQVLGVFGDQKISLTSHNSSALWSLGVTRCVYVHINKSGQPYINCVLKTMSTLAFTVYCLSQHPKVLAKLREEILNRVGTRRRPTPDDFRECRFLRAVINGAACTRLVTCYSFYEFHRNIASVSACVRRSFLCIIRPCWTSWISAR